MPDAIGIQRGFAGKIPCRGDFVSGGLPRDFADKWHDWQSNVIAGSRELMGEAWLEAFLEAPVWRFVLPPGLCGTRAAIGLIMPSVDKVGRYFPLTFAALPESGAPDDKDWSAWLDEVETLGRLALDEDVPPEGLTPPPPPAFAGVIDASVSTWWSDGGPRVAADRFTLPSLPDAARFASMLGFFASTESAP